MDKSYISMAGLSSLMRQFVLPNPFEQLPQSIVVILGGISVEIPPILLNVIVEPLLWIVTRRVVGIYYSQGEFPAWGSFLYLAFYALHVGLLTIIAKAQFAIWVVVLVICPYIACHIAAALFLNRPRWRYM